MIQTDNNISFSLSAFYVAVGLVTTVLTGVIALSTTYLRMFIKGATSDMRDEIMKNIEVKFPQKELIEFKIAGQERRLALIENKMETIRILKERDDQQHQ